ncbi:uncharacterized protein LOC125955596 [Anopheles darlingi]|uniref:uncharacterized protein LOC125955596 n=1 Tax=Anopheles darlingi TaxID=43151 RepID=UPI00210067D8|nr:uncharacterized protein LOC125955596 [Anopheles darlingi]
MRSRKLQGWAKYRILVMYRLRNAIDNSTINGFKWFWVTVLCGSFASMVFILLFTIDTYDETVSVNPDTAYLHWNSTFPAVSICYGKGSPKHISSFLKQHWADSNVTPSKSTSYLWPKVAQTYLFVSPNVNMDEDNAIVCTGLNSTCNLNLEVMRNCQDVLFDVSYRGVTYNCSQIFHYSITEMGSCFTANSIYDQWVLG